MADSLVCDHLCSTVHFSVLANGTDIGADTTGPVVFITDLYMVFCAGNFIHLVNAVLAFCETMGRAAFQAFSAVDAEIFLLHGICRDGRIGENGNDTKSWAEFLCDQVMAVTDGSHSRIISCHHMGKCRIGIIYQNINVIVTVLWEKDCLVSQTVHNIIGQTVCHIIQHPVAGVIKFLIDHRWRGAHHWRIQRNPQHDHIFYPGPDILRPEFRLLDRNFLPFRHRAGSHQIDSKVKRLLPYLVFQFFPFHDNISFFIIGNII